jgi:hypothetical protein
MLQVFERVTVEHAAEGLGRDVCEHYRERLGKPAKDGDRNLGKEVGKSSAIEGHSEIISAKGLGRKLG